MAESRSPAAAPGDGEALGSSIPIIAFTSGKGGCGKTTIAVNFAHLLADFGNNVLLIDFDVHNQGTTGLFSKQVKQSPHVLSLTAALNRGVSNGESLLRGDDKDRFVRPQSDLGLYVMPAIRADERQWRQPDSLNLESLVMRVRTLLLELAMAAGFTAVVLDCFCGLDDLTTAAAGAADKTIIVNEPDVVTFNGSTGFYVHLKRSLRNFPRKPAIHFVVNRVRRGQTIRELTQLYETNLDEEVGSAILCHFPYQNRIFESFGTHPFLHDLLPRSLFMRKLELLAHLLLKDEHPTLLREDVRNWTDRKVQGIYRRSFDGGSVDSEYLVLTLTRLPVALGVWSIAAIAVRALAPLLSFGTVWGLLILLGVALLMLLWQTLIRSFWLMTRLNFGVYAYKSRLVKLQPSYFTRFYKRLSLTSQFLTGLFVAVTTAALAGYWVFLLLIGSDFMFDVGFMTDSWDDPDYLEAPDYLSGLKARMVESQLILPGHVVDLRGQKRVAYVDFRPFWAVDPSFGPLFLDTDIYYVVENTNFIKCSFASDLLSGPSDFNPGTPISRITGCTFQNCSFGGRQIDEIRFQNVNFEEPRSSSGSPWKATFADSTFSESKIRLSAGSEISFERCSFNGERGLTLSAVYDKGNLARVTFIDVESKPPGVDVLGLDESILVFYGEGPISRAISKLERQIENYRNSTPTSGDNQLNNIAWDYVLLGREYEKKQDIDSAKKAWEQAVETIRPVVDDKALEDVIESYLDTYVVALLSLGRVEEARPVARYLLDSGWDDTLFVELTEQHDIFPEEPDR